jgi:triacylglycerol lipase
VNHLDLVGWINSARYKWAEIMGKEIKFHPATFYLGVVHMLSREVEGPQENEEPVSTQAKQTEEREQMFRSLEDAGAEAQPPRAKSPAKSTASSQSSTKSNGRITPPNASSNKSSRNMTEDGRPVAPKPPAARGTAQKLHKETNEGKDDQESPNQS